jgi:hypothetical protein
MKVLSFIGNSVNSEGVAQSQEGGSFKESFETAEAGAVALRSAGDGAEAFVHEVAGARTYYTTILGGTKYIGKARLLGYTEVLGQYTFYTGAVINVAGAIAGEQGWGKAALNVGVEALPFAIGAGPGAVIGVSYFVLDKTGGWEKAMTTTPNHPGTFTDENGNMELR